MPTTDGGCYYNKCATYGFGYSVPKMNGTAGVSYQDPKTGNAYIGLFFLNGPPQGDNRNYYQIKLKDSLKKGFCYNATFYVNNYDATIYGCNNIGVFLSKTAVYVDTNVNQFGVLYATPQILNYGNPIIWDTVNWVKVSSVYEAKGGEQYLTLGNFNDDANTQYKMFQQTGGYQGALYYVDDVSVVPLDSVPLQADAGQDITIKLGDSVFIGSLTNGITNINWRNSSGAIINTVAPGFYVKPAASTFYVVEQTVCGFTSRDTVNVYVNPLPLKFISLTLNPSPTERDFIVAKWITANEVNVSHQNIQRSNDGKTFETIGTVKALNNSYNEYSFIDELKPNTQYPTPLYYKIESIDKDGRKSYSAIKTVIINHSSLNVTIYPNPTKDIVNIYSKEGIKEVKLINTLGQIVKQQMFSNPVNSLPWRVGEAKGLYFVQVETKNGGLFNEKIIKE